MYKQAAAARNAHFVDLGPFFCKWLANSSKAMHHAYICTCLRNASMHMRAVCICGHVRARAHVYAVALDTNILCQHALDVLCMLCMCTCGESKWHIHTPLRQTHDVYPTHSHIYHSSRVPGKSSMLFSWSTVNPTRRSSPWKRS